MQRLFMSAVNAFAKSKALLPIAKNINLGTGSLDLSILLFSFHSSPVNHIFLLTDEQKERRIMTGVF